MTLPPAHAAVTVTFAGSGDAFGSGGRYQACIHLRPEGGDPVLLDCGATSLSALKRLGLDPGEIAAVFVSHLHGDHFGGLPFLILDGQFSRRTRPLTVVAPPGTSRSAHQEQITARRVILTHMSTDMLDSARDADGKPLEHAYDGLTIRL